MPTEKATINGQVKKSILLLNHHIPADKAKLWVTATEMRDRLVHSGVHQTLTVDMVVDALRRANKDETLIRKRQFHLINYFIPSIYPDTDELPNDQRFNNRRGGREQRVHINPDRNFFRECGGAAKHLKFVNKALEAIATANNTASANTNNSPAANNDSDTNSGDNADETEQTTGDIEFEMEQPRTPETANNTASANTNNSPAANNDSDTNSGDNADETEQTTGDIEFEMEQPRNDEMEAETEQPRTPETGVQTEPVAMCHDVTDVPPYNGNIIMDCDHMDDFIREATCHSAKCGQQLILIERNTKMGAGVTEVWMCPVCSKKLQFQNCKWVKTTVVEEGKKYSRRQPEINLKIAKLFEAGVNMCKVMKSVSERLGIKMSNRDSLMHQQRKVKAAIKEVAEKRIIENRREHVALTRSAEDYGGDLVYEKDGEKRSTCVGNVSIDGAGCTRAYNHRIKGKQSLFIVNSSITKKPLCMIHSQISCYRCTLAMNKRINEHEQKTGETVTLDQYCNFSREHAGECYRNSKYNPASAEENQATDAARDLLLDEDGNYRGDDTAIFCERISADNDTRACKNLIKEQADIVGEAANGRGEHDPDQGHTFKGSNNRLFKLRDEHPSLKGSRALSNVRIKSLQSDFRGPVKDYHEEGIGNEAAKCKCLKQIRAVPFHHSGDHSKCFQEKYCTFIKVRNENPTWSDEQVETEASNTSKRHGGKYMSIGKKAMEIITHCIEQTFNSKSIDRIARCGNSNASEAFFGSLTQFSEGKRTNLDQADAWSAMAHLCVAIAGEGNKEKTHFETSALLGIKINELEILQMKRTTKKSKKDSLTLLPTHH